MNHWLLLIAWRLTDAETRGWRRKKKEKTFSTRFKELSCVDGNKFHTISTSPSDEEWATVNEWLSRHEIDGKVSRERLKNASEKREKFHFSWFHRNNGKLHPLRVQSEERQENELSERVNTRTDEKEGGKKLPKYTANTASQIQKRKDGESGRSNEIIDASVTAQAKINLQRTFVHQLNRCGKFKWNERSKARRGRWKVK